jgi:hypothetical protein
MIHHRMQWRTACLAAVSRLAAFVATPAQALEENPDAHLAR